MILTPVEVTTEAILAALSHTGEDNGMYLAKTAKRERQDIFDEEKSFNGDFDINSLTNSVPNSLLLLVQMLLEGTRNIAVYFKNSIKAPTRINRGFRTRIKVANTTPLPRNWKSFLRVDKNKSEVFQLQVVELVQQSDLYCSH